MKFNSLRKTLNKSLAYMMVWAIAFTSVNVPVYADEYIEEVAIESEDVENTEVPVETPFEDVPSEELIEEPASTEEVTEDAAVTATEDEITEDAADAEEVEVDSDIEESVVETKDSASDLPSLYDPYPKVAVPEQDGGTCALYAAFNTMKMCALKQGAITDENFDMHELDAVEKSVKNDGMNKDNPDSGIDFSIASVYLPKNFPHWNAKVLYDNLDIMYNQNNIKQIIYDLGAVGVSSSFGNDWTGTLNCVLHPGKYTQAYKESGIEIEYWEDMGYNPEYAHAISISGWDDRELYIPADYKSKGTWIVRNSCYGRREYWEYTNNCYPGEKYHAKAYSYIYDNTDLYFDDYDLIKSTRSDNAEGTNHINNTNKNLIIKYAYVPYDYEYGYYTINGTKHSVKFKNGNYDNYKEKIKNQDYITYWVKKEYASPIILKPGDTFDTCTYGDADYLYYYDETSSNSKAFSINEGEYAISADDTSAQVTVTKSAGTGTLTYKSSDENIFTVDKNGKITPHYAGKATLTVSNGIYEDERVVYVSRYLEDVVKNEGATYSLGGVYVDSEGNTKYGGRDFTYDGEEKNIYATFYNSKGDNIQRVYPTKGEYDAISAGTHTAVLNNMHGVAKEFSYRRASDDKLIEDIFYKTKGELTIEYTIKEATTDTSKYITIFDYNSYKISPRLYYNPNNDYSTFDLVDAGNVKDYINTGNGDNYRKNYVYKSGTTYKKYNTTWSSSFLYNNTLNENIVSCSVVDNRIGTNKVLEIEIKEPNKEKFTIQKTVEIVAQPMVVTELELGEDANKYLNRVETDKVTYSVPAYYKTSYPNKLMDIPVNKLVVSPGINQALNRENASIAIDLNKCDITNTYEKLEKLKTVGKRYVMYDGFDDWNESNFTASDATNINIKYEDEKYPFELDQKVYYAYEEHPLLDLSNAIIDDKNFKEENIRYTVSSFDDIAPNKLEMHIKLYFTDRTGKTYTRYIQPSEYIFEYGTDINNIPWNESQTSGKIYIKPSETSNLKNSCYVYVSVHTHSFNGTPTFKWSNTTNACGESGNPTVTASIKCSSCSTTYNEVKVTKTKVEGGYSYKAELVGTKFSDTKVFKHDIKVISQGATCQHDGEYGEECKNCNYKKTEHEDIKAHEKDSGTVTKNPTESSKGETTYKCKWCGTHMQTVANIPMLVTAKLNMTSIHLKAGDTTKLTVTVKNHTKFGGEGSVWKNERK